MLQFPAAEFFYEGPDVAAFVVAKQGDLIPPAEESFNHTARVCRIGPDNKLYIALGQPFNVPPKDKMDLYKRVGIGGIVRMDQDGKNREVYATGIRNSVGIDFNPADKTLWFTDNQVDGMGDDQPPGRAQPRSPRRARISASPITAAARSARSSTRTIQVPAGVVGPQAEMDPHAADLGMMFYTGTHVPPELSGRHLLGPARLLEPHQAVGARVMFTPLKPDGTADKPQVFAEGWLTENGEYLGRPVDVAMLPDGSLLVSDDTAGAIYRISYEGR